MSRRHASGGHRDILSHSRLHSVPKGIRTRDPHPALPKVCEHVFEHPDGRGHRLVNPHGERLGHRMLVQPLAHAGHRKPCLLINGRVRVRRRQPLRGEIAQASGRLEEPPLGSIHACSPQLEGRLSSRITREQPLVVGAGKVGRPNRPFDTSLERCRGGLTDHGGRLAPAQHAHPSTFTHLHLRSAPHLVALEPDVSGTYCSYRHDRDTGHARRWYRVAFTPARDRADKRSDRGVSHENLRGAVSTAVIERWAYG